MSIFRFLVREGARGAIDGVAAPDDPLRPLKLGVFGGVLVVGWLFILWANNFHVTAPVVMVCLAYLAVVALILNLWRTGAAAVASDDGDWGRPLGAQGELEKEKKTLLKAIKEAEFDFAMGKLSKHDSDSLIRQYRARAIEVIKELDHAGDRAALSVREQIEGEVKARRELASQDKPSKRAKNAAAAKAAKAEPTAAKVKPVVEAATATATEAATVTATATATEAATATATATDAAAATATDAATATATATEAATATDAATATATAAAAATATEAATAAEAAAEAAAATDAAAATTTDAASGESR